MKKAAIFSALALCGTVASANGINQFETLKNTYKQSHNIRFAIHFEQCENLSSKEHFLKNTAIYTPNEVLISDNYFTTSLDHFTKDNPLFPSVPVIEHIRFLFKNDGYLYLSTEILNPVDYSSMSEVYSVRCMLNDKAVSWAAV